MVTMLVVTTPGDADNGDRRPPSAVTECYKCVNAAAQLQSRLWQPQCRLSRLLAAQIQGRRGTAGSGHLLTADQSPWRRRAAQQAGR